MYVLAPHLLKTVQSGVATDSIQGGLNLSSIGRVHCDDNLRRLPGEDFRPMYLLP